MPKEFEEAVRKGAKVRTKKLPGGKYIHIAVLGKRKSVGGEVHKKKGNPSVPKKKEKKKESWVGKLKKKVRKHFDKEKKKKKKKEFETARTKQTKERLRKAGLSEAEIKRLQDKKKK